MTPGDNTLALVEELCDEGAEHIVLLMRHSAREYEPGRHDLLNPLTEEGRSLARTLGSRLPKSLTIRGYSSPAERCIETAELIMAGHGDQGGETLRNRVIEALGVFYVLDQMKMYMAMQEAGGIIGFLQKWFAGEIARDILMPPDLAAGLVGQLAAAKLEDRKSGPQLDVLVSHDFTLYTVKDRLLGQDTERFPEVKYLDAVALFQRDGETWIQSHHEPAIQLNTKVPG